MTETFLHATDWQPQGDGLFAGTFAETWYQGRGAYGGVVAGGLARCMERHVAEPRRPLRSCTVHFAAPAVAGPVVVEVNTEREGALVTHLSARARQGGAVVAIATGTCAGARRVASSADLRLAGAPLPDVPPADEVPSLPADHPLLPAFARHFDYRFCFGAWPYSGASSASLGGWIAPRIPVPLDAPLLLGLLDAFPPAILCRSRGPRPAASVDMSTRLYCGGVGSPMPLGGPCFLLARTEWSADGYGEEKASLWSAAGQLLAECHQLVAVLG